MPSAIELFSGCGGLSTGLIAAGFEVLSAVEINQTAADTYGLNHPTVNLIVDDVRNVTAVSLLPIICSSEYSLFSEIAAFAAKPFFDKAPSLTFSLK